MYVEEKEAGKKWCWMAAKDGAGASKVITNPCVGRKCMAWVEADNDDPFEPPVGYCGPVYNNKQTGE